MWQSGKSFSSEALHAAPSALGMAKPAHWEELNVMGHAFILNVSTTSDFPELIFWPQEILVFLLSVISENLFSFTNITQWHLLFKESKSEALMQLVHCFFESWPEFCKKK